MRATRDCEHCGKPFLQFRSTQRICGKLRCAVGFAKGKREAERAKLNAKKEADRTIPELIALSDKAFAGYIRLRDRIAGHPCISSGKPLDWTGNKVDAGHYRSRGAASHLRYNEDNCHAQSKRDNLWKSGNVVEYRIRLVARIGLERVESLEGDNRVHHWTKDELRAIAALYRTKRKELEKARNDD